MVSTLATTSWPSSDRLASSAPASMAASIMPSSLATTRSNSITPTRSNMNDTAPVSASAPPDLVK